MLLYNIADFGAMIDCSIRMDAYRRALASTITPGSVVLDLGTGTGIMAMLACQHGARRVYAIESSDAIQIARESAAENDFADRIVFIQDHSSRVSLPEQVDVIVEDLRGALPWLETHIPDVIDARRRFLKPHGRIISRRDRIYCAVVELNDFYQKLVRPWRTPLAGLNLSAAARYAVNSTCRILPGAEQMLTRGHVWAELEYATIDSPNAIGNFCLEFSRAGTGHGLLLWFDAELAPGIWIHNAPGQSSTPYCPMFLPWPEPIAVDEGGRVEVDLRGDLFGGNYLWTWSTRVYRRSGEQSPVMQSRQSTLLGTPLTPRTLARRASSHRPRLNLEGLLTQSVLAKMQGAMPLEEIADQLAVQYADRFQSRREAFDYVARLSGIYGD